MDSHHHHHHHFPLKKPKLEDPIADVPITDEKPVEQQEDESPLATEDHEEALLALIAHRTHEVEHNKQRVAYYITQLEASERRLRESQTLLVRLRSQRSAASAAASSLSPPQPPPPPPPPPRRRLIIPAVKPKNLTPLDPPPRPKASSTVLDKRKQETISRVSLRQCNEKKRATRMLEKREHRELIPSVCSCSSPCTISFQGSTHISSQHKRKLRCLAPSPVNDQMFVTSALDGVVNFWELQSEGHTASLLSTTDCMSLKQRRWPEDITWHPDGDSLFAVYSAEGGDSQISILNLKHSGDKKVVFLEEKPHLKGIINSIIFMPWVDLCFATGGCDHAVILWNEKENSWKPKTLHRNQHSSAVMGVAGLQQNKVILSVGADKRIVGFDLLAETAEFKHQIDTKCMSVLPNPSDFNMFMVQTGQQGKQLRLYDYRVRQNTEIHTFGWKQSSESQSALISQAWSPDGLYLSSGSADPIIHIFDIRYNGSNPSQSVQAHQRRVFKAVWHRSVPILTSISSDLNIGLHRIS